MKINICVPGIKTNIIEDLALNEEITFRDAMGSGYTSHRRNQNASPRKNSEDIPQMKEIGQLELKERFLSRHQHQGSILKT